MQMFKYTAMSAAAVREAYRDGILRYDEAIDRLVYDNRMTRGDAIAFCPE